MGMSHMRSLQQRKPHGASWALHAHRQRLAMSCVESQCSACKPTLCKHAHCASMRVCMGRAGSTERLRVGACPAARKHELREAQLRCHHAIPRLQARPVPEYTHGADRPEHPAHTLSKTHPTPAGSHLSANLTS